MALSLSRSVKIKREGETFITQNFNQVMKKGVKTIMQHIYNMSQQLKMCLGSLVTKRNVGCEIHWQTVESIEKKELTAESTDK